jgi:hypothetical protein
MTHQDWQAEMKAALDLGADNKADAARRLERLAARAFRHSRAAVGDWHFEQSLGLAATTLDEAGRHKEAARLYKRLTQHHEQSLTYQGKALASTQAALALALFAGGERAAGCKAGLEALKWAGQFQNASAQLEKALREVRAYLNDKAQRARRSTRKRKAR